MKKVKATLEAYTPDPVFLKPDDRQKTVLILENEKILCLDLKNAFEASTKYTFVAHTARSLHECIKQGLQEMRFQVCVVDLMLNDRQPVLLEGLIAIQQFRNPGTEIVVYSNFPAPEYIVRAVRAGATDFVPKLGCSPAALVQRIEAAFDERTRLAEREEKIRMLEEQERANWQKKYKGGVIVLVGDKVVAQGTNHFAAYVNYETARARHKAWPAVPDFIEIG